MILLILNIFLLIVGTFMDMAPALLIFTPIFLPIVQSFGMSPIHFGVMMVMNLSVGTITPPVGNVLFVCGMQCGKTAGRAGYETSDPALCGNLCSIDDGNLHSGTQRMAPYCFGASGVIVFL